MHIVRWCWITVVGLSLIDPAVAPAQSGSSPGEQSPPASRWTFTEVEKPFLVEGSGLSALEADGFIHEAIKGLEGDAPPPKYLTHKPTTRALQHIVRVDQVAPQADSHTPLRLRHLWSGTNEWLRVGASNPSVHLYLTGRPELFAEEVVTTLELQAKTALPPAPLHGHLSSLLDRDAIVSRPTRTMEERDSRKKQYPQVQRWVPLTEAPKRIVPQRFSIALPKPVSTRMVGTQHSPSSVDLPCWVWPRPPPLAFLNI